MGDAREGYSANLFFRDYFQSIIVFLMVAITSLIALAGLVVYQITHRPSPEFSAVDLQGKTTPLTSYLEPNLRAAVILRWASKVATLSYNFGFSDYEKKIKSMRPYFTPLGWQAYVVGLDPVVERITKNQLIVQGVVSGAPVISNQGELPGVGYSWRVQIPFLVTYLSSDQSRANSYYVVMNITKVPTYLVPEGIGIDTYSMSR